jgi:hypothetical protein
MIPSPATYSAATTLRIVFLLLFEHVLLIESCVHLAKCLQGKQPLVQLLPADAEGIVLARGRQRSRLGTC